MPKTTTTSNSLKSLLAKAHAEHKGDETKMPAGGAGLPPGIEQGIAKLVKFEVKKFEKGDTAGQYFFAATGVVFSPEEHNGVKVLGQQTRIQEPLCDSPTRTRKTVTEHYDWILNELRKLGLNTSETEPDDIIAEDGNGGFVPGPTLVAMTDTDADPIYFRFRTWVGQKAKDGPYKDKEPRVQEQWLGVTTYQEDEAGTTAVDDRTEPDKEAEAPWEDDAKQEEAQPEQEVPTTKDKPDESGEWLELAALADNPKNAKVASKAQEKIVGLAKMFNIDHEAEAYSSWTDVVNAILEASNADKPAEEEAAGPVIPSAGDMGYYKPAGAKKYLEVEVKAVFEAAKKLNLADTTTNKIYKGVPMDEFKDELPSKK